MTLLLGMTALLLALLLVEAALLRRARRAVDCRVLVTGTRGKSSLVRILVEALRTTDPAIMGKTTGDAPELLPPGGGATRLRRRGPPRLHEQARLLLAARRQGVRCLVLESMAITPETMRAEARLLRPDLTVITNVRDDHRETLGSRPDSQRDAYLDAMERGSRWTTIDAGLVAYAAGRGRVPVAACGAEPRPDVGTVERELSLLASTVLSTLGRDTPAALAVVRREAAVTAAAAERIRPLALAGRPYRLLDGFSANDPHSLEALWLTWRRLLPDEEDWDVLLSTRADRPLRTRQFCEWLVARQDVGVIHVAGDHCQAAVRLLRREGADARILPASLHSVAGEGHADQAAQGRCLVGIGNARGVGLGIRAATEPEVA